MYRALSVTSAFHSVSGVWPTSNLYICWMGGAWVQWWVFSLIYKLYETWMHSCSSGRISSFIRYLRFIANVSAFGYSNLKRDSKRLDILWCLHVANRPLPFPHQDASGIDATESPLEGLSNAVPAAVFGLPTDICKAWKQQIPLGNI